MTSPKTDSLTVTIQTDTVRSRQDRTLQPSKSAHHKTRLMPYIYLHTKVDVQPTASSCCIAAGKRPDGLPNGGPCLDCDSAQDQLLRGQSIGEEKLVAKSRAVIPTKTVLTYRVDS